MTFRVGYIPDFGVPVTRGQASFRVWFMSPVISADPAWWSQPGTKIWTGEAAPPNLEHDAPVSVGQLKHVAKQAKAYLDQKLASVGGSGDSQSEIAALLASFSYVAQDGAPASVGRLEHVAAPFYRRLNVVGVDVRPLFCSPMFRLRKSRPSLKSSPNRAGHIFHGTQVPRPWRTPRRPHRAVEICLLV